MDGQRQNKVFSRNKAILVQWMILLVLTFSITSAYGQVTTGEDFNTKVDVACNLVPRPPSLGDLCTEFSLDGGGPNTGADVGGQNNFDTLGAQNQTTAEKEQRGQIFQAPTWGVFGSVNIGNRSRSTTRLENGYDGDVIGGAIGVDKSLSDKLVAGLVLGQYRFDADFDLAAGSIETETRSVALFLAYDHNETSTISFYVGRDSLDLETVRNIQVSSGPKQASSNTEGSQNVAGVNLYFGWPMDAWVIGADLSIDYVDAKIDAFQEFSTLGNTTYLLSYPDQNIESLTISTGFEVAYNASMSWGVLVPRLRLAYMRETENEAREVVSSLVVEPSVSFTTTTDAADKDFFAGSIGASAVLAGDWQLFTDATTFAGNGLLDSWVINVGIHKQF